MCRAGTVLFFISLFVGFQSFAGNGSWELEKDESGIKIYTRTVEGEDIREFKAITTIKASRKSIATLITDIANYTTWYPDIAEAEVLKKISPTEFYVYNVLDLPWPASDRDNVSKMTISKTSTRTTVKFRSITGVKDVEDDYVRIVKSYGFWILESQGDNTKVHFQYFASPGGSLPDWIINMFIVDNPFETLTIIKDKLE